MTGDIPIAFSNSKRLGDYEPKITVILKRIKSKIKIFSLDILVLFNTRIFILDRYIPYIYFLLLI